MDSSAAFIRDVYISASFAEITRTPEYAETVRVKMREVFEFYLEMTFPNLPDFIHSRCMVLLLHRIQSFRRSRSVDQFSAGIRRLVNIWRCERVDEVRRWVDFCLEPKVRRRGV